ncbi:MAG: cytochrome c [Pseudomonadota bacterium]
MISTRIATATLAISLAFAGSANAADPNAAIKYRKDVMSVIGGSVTAIAAILKEEAGARADLAALTQILALAADPAIIDTAFEMNTDGQGSEKTTAKANIWTDMDKFKAINVKLNEAAADAAKAGANVTFNEMKPVFAQCKACHDDFRQK